MDESQLLAKIAEWTPEAKEKALAEFRARSNKTRKVWYCEKGRACDGKPHDGYDYSHARSDQWPPPGTDWFLWLLAGGRGSGKTVAGAQYVRQLSKRFPRIALIGATTSDIRDTMVEGVSGLQATFAAAGEEIDYKPALKRITFPSGAIAGLFSAEEPDRLRGPQHHCFPAGTMVQTRRGLKPIEHVLVGEEVATRYGYSVVRAAGARWAESTVVIGHRQGVLRASPDHPIFIVGRGWVAAEFVQPGDTLVAWQDETSGAPTGPVTPTGTSTAGWSTSTGGSGSSTTVRYQAALTSTTSTTTLATTTSPTWPSSLVMSTLRTMRPNGVTGLMSPPPARTAVPSTSEKDSGPLVPSGVPGVGAEWRRGPDDSWSGSAASAENRSPRVTGTSAVSAVSTSVGAIVYNLTVGPDPEFFAEGVLVHNCFWMDEPAHFPLIEEVWDQMLFGLRLGTRPHGVCTTTPLPNRWIKTRIGEPTTRVSRVSTYANLDNLAPTFKQTILDRYEGTRLGKQELHGEILGDVEGALWSEPMIMRGEIRRSELDRIIVAIDPAGSVNKRSDETGIVVVGRKGRMGYVLEDRSGKYSPNGWAEKAIEAYDRWKADAIIAEKNFGGDMVRTTIESVLKEKDTYARIKVTTAARSKAIRAEPIVALYEQLRVLHVGKFTDLEDEQLTWIPGTGASPNRVDALVWGMTELFGATTEARIGRVPARQLPQRPGSDQGAVRPGIRRPMKVEESE